MLDAAAACLDVSFDSASGRVTAQVVDWHDGQPVPLRADPLTLYAPFGSQLEGATEATRVWLRPLDAVPDPDAVLRATLFAGESGTLRGAHSVDAMVVLVVVRGVSFWGVRVHVEGSATWARADAARPAGHGGD